MRGKNFIILTVAIGAGAILAGCDGPLAELPGHYEGTVFERPDASRAGTQQPVRAEITNLGKGRAKVEARDIKNNGVLKIELSAIEDEHFKIAIPGVTEGAVELKRAEGCYSRQGRLALRFCLDKGELMLEAVAEGQGTIFTLALDRFRKIDSFKLETPEAYTLTRAVDQSLKRNFDNRAEFEAVRQARLTRTLSKLNLLPGVTLPSIIAVATHDAASMLSSIGDLVPFLLPTRWLQMLEAGKRAKAEEDALILMRADTATQVEGFAYLLARDRAMLQFYRDTLVSAKNVLAQIEAREDLGLLPLQAGDDARTVVNGIEQALIGMELSVQEDLTGIAQTLGNHNPEAVTDVSIDTELEPIDEARSHEYDVTIQTAIDRSFELRQMDALIEVARYQKTERYFNWIDPAGDYTGKLGFGIGQYVAVGKSQIDQLVIKREQTQAQLAGKVVNTLKEYENSLRIWGLVKENMIVQERRLGRIVTAASFGTSGDLTGMVQIFQDYLGGAVARESTIASYRVARAKIDRLLLQGYFRGLAQRPDPK
jgi:hypothetical protein